MADLVEHMAYTGDDPWWLTESRRGQATKLNGPATAEEAIVAGGLDWEVEMKPIYVLMNGGNTAQRAEKYFAVVRKTDHRIYSIASKRYVPIQNHDSFKFFDAVVGEGQAVYNTVGSIKNGAQIWLLAKLPGSISIRGDEVEKFLVLKNSHDGSQARKMFWSTIRVVCSNTLEMAESRAAAIFYSRHTKRAGSIENVTLAQEFLGLADKHFAEFKEKAEFLASQEMKMEAVTTFLNNLFGNKDGLPMEQLYKPKQYEMVEIHRRFDGEGKGLNDPKIRGTKYSMYNAVAEYVDWSKPLRKGGDKIAMAWFGAGNDLKNRALDLLLKS